MKKQSIYHGIFWNNCQVCPQAPQPLRLSRPELATALQIPVDSTVITLTSKLGYHQIQLLNGFSVTENLTSEAVRHDISFREEVIKMIPDNAVAIMDRGFASWKFLDELCEAKRKFIVRIKNNMRTEVNHDRYRVVHFWDIDSKTEFRIATNLWDLTDEEVAELYRQRWAIENLWKFLKMHLSLDRLITKSVNGVVNQIYMVLIAYLILELVDVPEYFGRKLLDKLRYVQLELSRRCSIVHWSFDWQPELRVA
ncbi:transposase [Thermosynechococcus sichuanensis E542]|uniref:Transposase n=1 Tax=Thermosynechococcus sichuanensis E542 TaxID=2016101 RepID=A0A3B7MLX4_9CYAN|nr:transposase [Thermosynechococcus vestitus]AXY68126.1 transposase [Thermosynechococcus vestitus E542]